MEQTVVKKPLRDWSAEERVHAVKDIFDAITPHYDLLNRIMSGRQDVRWRRFAVTRIPSDAMKVLDVATGTADLAVAIAKGRPGAKVVGVDFVESMMRVGLNKTAKQGLRHRIAFVAGDAMRLPFGEGEFDAATIAFGIRNIPDRSAALKEMARVVRPGGKVITLEMTFPRNLRLRNFFKWYLNSVIPLVGGFVSGNREAYRYLPDSIQDFLSPDELSDTFRNAGLIRAQRFPLMFGLTYVHEGVRP